jgi:hypothetical protein
MTPGLTVTSAARGFPVVSGSPFTREQLSDDAGQIRRSRLRALLGEDRQACADGD